jgi:transposase
MRLPEHEIHNLILFHRQLTRQKDADKVKCLIYWGKGYSWEQIKELLFLSDGSIKNFIDAYKKGGVSQLLKTQYEGHNYKLTPEQEQNLSEYVERYNVLTSGQAVHYVKKKFDVDFTINGMTRTLKRLGFSYKKPKRAPCKADKIEEKLFFYRYLLKSKDLPQDESLLFLDGAGMVHNAKMDYGWSKKGQPRKVKTNTGRKRLNINAAYDIKKHKVISIFHEENVNTTSNIHLLEKIRDAYSDKRKITIILDHAKMNKSKELFRYIKERNKAGPVIELMYVPPYCPHLNLIERLWRFMKKKLLANKYYSNYTKFKQAIKSFLTRKLKKLKKELRSLMTEKFEGLGDLGRLQI